MDMVLSCAQANPANGFGGSGSQKGATGCRASESREDRMLVSCGVATYMLSVCHDLNKRLTSHSVA